MAIYPAKLDKIPSETAPICGHCGGPPYEYEQKSYVYYCEELGCWLHRSCVHKFFATPRGRLALKPRPAVTVADEA